MLAPLVTVPALVRASSRPARHLWRTANPQLSCRQALYSSSIQPLYHDTHDDHETDETDNHAAKSRRHLSKDSPFSHFFDKRVPTSINKPSKKPRASHDIAAASRDAVSAFREAISTRDPDQILDAYAFLGQAQRRHVRDVQASSSRAVESAGTSFPVRKGDIQTAIRYIIQHAQTKRSMEPRFVEACHQLFLDMSQLFGFRIGPTDLHRQLQAYCLAKSATYDPVERFEQLRNEHPDWQTTPVDWNLVISYLARRRWYNQAIKVWRDMSDHGGVRPNASIRISMIKVFLAVDSTAEAFVQAKELVKEEETLDTLTAAVEVICKLVESNAADAKPIRELQSYTDKLRKVLEATSHAGRNSAAWQVLLRYDAMVVGPADALQIAKAAFAAGALDSSTVSLLLRLHVDELNNLQSSDEALELLDRIHSAIDPQRTTKVGDQCYSTLMLGLLNNVEAQDGADASPDELGVGIGERSSRTLPSPNQIHEAQILYDHVRTLGLPATPSLVRPLLTAYCEAFLPSLPSAMKLVKDMLQPRPSVSSSTREWKDARTSTIDMSSIQPVVDACIKLKDVTTVRSLLSQLRNASITITPSEKTKLICRLLPIATSWQEAFSIYRFISRFLTPSSPPAQDDRGHVSVLATFCSLSLTTPAPPEDLLSIVSSHPTSPQIYTLLLDYYSKQSSPSYLGVQMTHELLKRDAYLEPDLPLINALMNAYNWTEEPAMVFAIWDSLVATRQGVDGVTMSVVFDAAGRHGLLTLARRALATARRWDAEGEASTERVMTKGAWDSWLECLARCGRLEEAIEVVCGEMRRTLLKDALERGELEEGTGGLTLGELVGKAIQAPVKDRWGRVIGPDAKTLTTLLKFAARERDRRKRQADAPLLLHDRSCSRTAGGNSIWHTLRTRIREDFSWVYPHVRHIGQNATP